ncbi:MAG: 3-deoxy-manno-octulosonate cytidylyltransferase [Calditrichaeota bacterium]|nr:3-deoxy-manno-octulosonate cytidylyltransferase [Calditrichota bacterium]
MKICAIIPARMGSTRLQNKPLIRLAGKAMIVRVCEGSAQSKRIDKVIVATDSEQIRTVVEAAGFDCVMTSKDCKSGTDRVREAAQNLDGYDLIVNVQGDEPLISGEVIDQAIEQFLQSDCDMGTIASRKLSIDEYKSPDKVKLVLNKRNEAMYFSRATIPFNRDQDQLPENALLHIGIYLYKPVFLDQFVSLTDSQLEDIEKLEQLRVLENGFRISVAVTDYESIGVDVIDDIKRVEERLTGKLNEEQN